MLSHEHHTAVKICGFKREHMNEWIPKLSMQYIGFVLAPSKRQVNPEFVRDFMKPLISNVDRPQAVGVFVNPTMEQLISVLAVAPLDVIQLHGQESPDFCHQVRQQLDKPVIKVFSLQDQQPEKDAKRLKRYKDTIDAVLLDTHDPIYGGGSGKTFNWDVIPQWKNAAHGIGVRLFVAGGLDEENVQQLIEQYQPDGVDISSGVEIDGEKSLVKIRNFIERVRSSEAIT